MPNPSETRSVAHLFNLKVPRSPLLFPPTCYIKLSRWPAHVLLPDSDRLSWESSSWEKQQEEVTEHLCRGGLHQDSFHRGFTLDDKDVLLQWSNLQPTHWAPEQSTDTVPPADCPGYYQVTILGKETPGGRFKGASLRYSKHCNYSTIMLVLSSFYLKPKVKNDDPVW